MKRTLTACLIAVLVAPAACRKAEPPIAAPSPAPAPAAAKTSKEKAVEAGRTLLAEGRFDEALSAYRDFASDKMGQDILDRAAQAREKGDVGRALGLCRAYFEVFPFGPYLSWSSDSEEWSKVATAYAALIEAAPREVLDAKAQRDLAALDDLKRFTAYVDRERYRGGVLAARDPAEAAALREMTDHCIAEHPGSVACLGAVLATCGSAGVRRNEDGESYSRDWKRAREELAALLARVEKPGEPSRAGILIRYEMAQWSYEAENREASLLARDVYTDIARLTPFTWEKQQCLFRAARETGGAGEKDEARKRFAAIVREYPRSRVADQAREAIVRSWISQDNDARMQGVEQGLAALREIEKDAPPEASFAGGIEAVAFAYGINDDYDRAFELYREILRRYPETPDALRAHVAMANLYRETKKPEAALAEYRAAALMRTRDFGDDWPAAWALSEAVDSLSRHHMERKEWAEALRWTEQWAPSGWCGNCALADRRERVGRIVTCQAHLLRADDALRTFARMEAESDWSALESDLVVLLVDVFRENGREAELASALKSAVAAEGKHENATAAVTYLEILALFEGRDVAGLWKKMGFGGHPFGVGLFGDDWPRPTISKLLASLGDGAKLFVLSRLEASDDDERFQALFTLARMKAPETLPRVQREIDAADEEYDLQRAFTAAALLGSDDARALLREYAENGTEGQKKQAANVLEEYFPPPEDAAGAGEDTD